MKKIIAFTISIFVMATSFACEWETFADYELWCFEKGIEPDYTEYEYYADKEGQCYPTENEESEIEFLFAMANSDN